MKIDNISKSDYQTLITIWEASVRATHDFLTEADIMHFRPLILEQYFDAVDLRCVKDATGKILGFSGVAEQNLEMLFVDPAFAGQGVGSLLTRYVIDHQDVVKVDVNEQNPKALGFYRHMGFEVVKRSPTDGHGKPFPMLHLALKD